MIIKITSDNPHLLDVLNKNPKTDKGLYLKTLVNGVLVGNCVNSNRYDVLFQDEKNSFTNYSSNQLDFKSFCDPRVLLKVLSELFSHLLAYPQDEKIKWLDKSYAEIDNYPCTFYIENIWIPAFYVRNDKFFLSKYLDGFTTTAKGVNVYSLSYTGKSILEAFSVMALCGFLLQINSDEPLFLTEDILKKYVKILGNIKQAPYFLYYLLNKQLGFRNQHLVLELQEAYKRNNNIDCSFTPNSTQDDRIEFVRTNLDFNNAILDYGCGEFSHTKALARNIKTPFYSYDLEDYSELYNRVKDRYKDKQWIFTMNLEDVPSDVPLSVIASEVIEHNEIGHALWLLKDLLLKKNVKQLVITTPNVEFNKYYNLEGLRHNDHVQELDKKEFRRFVRKLGGKRKYFNISDVVGDEPTTFGVVINYE